MNNLLSEHSIQASFVDDISFRYRNDPTFFPSLFFSVPNGLFAGGESDRARFGLINKFKREGFKSGVFDVFYAAPRGEYPYLVIEFKKPERRRQKNGGLSDAQLEFKQQAERTGAMVAVCYSTEEACQVFDEYMMLDPRI